MPVFLVLGFLSPSNQRGARRPPPWRSLTFRLMRGKSSHNPALPYFLKFILFCHFTYLPYPTLPSLPPALSPLVSSSVTGITPVYISRVHF